MYGVILGVDFIFDLQNTFTHLKTRENVESFCKTVFRAVAVINGCKVSTTPLLRTIESRRRDFSHQACFLPPRMPQCRMIPQNISVIELIRFAFGGLQTQRSCQYEINAPFRIILHKAYLVVLIDFWRPYSDSTCLLAFTTAYGTLFWLPLARFRTG